MVRGEALLLDMDYDEAVQDFRAALDLMPDDDEHFREEKRELHHNASETRWNSISQLQQLPIIIIVPAAEAVACTRCRWRRTKRAES